jgi:hypothetical protein
LLDAGGHESDCSPMADNPPPGEELLFVVPKKLGPDQVGHEGPPGPGGAYFEVHQGPPDLGGARRQLNGELNRAALERLFSQSQQGNLHGGPPGSGGAYEEFHQGPPGPGGAFRQIYKLDDRKKAFQRLLEKAMAGQATEGESFGRLRGENE